MSAGGGYPPPTDGALLTSLSLAHRQDMLSTGKWANFLPVGKDFTIPARHFLPVGNGLRGSPAKVTKRHDGRGRREAVSRQADDNFRVPAIRPESAESSK